MRKHILVLFLFFFACNSVPTSKTELSKNNTITGKNTTNTDNNKTSQNNSSIPQQTQSSTETKNNENINLSKNNPIVENKTITDKNKLNPLPTVDNKSTENIKTEFIPATNTNINTYTPKFDIAREVPEGIRNANLNVFFKDNYKVRWDFANAQFKSLNNSDLTNINNILKIYNVKVETLDSAITKSEEELENEERQAEAVYGTDYPNKASIYSFSAENVNVRELIDKLRKDSFVLSANEVNG